MTRDDLKGLLALAGLVVCIGAGIWSVATGEGEPAKTPEQATPCDKSRTIAGFFYSGAQEAARDNRPEDYVAAMDTAARTILESQECFSPGQVDGAAHYLGAP